MVWCGIVLAMSMGPCQGLDAQRLDFPLDPRIMLQEVDADQTPSNRKRYSDLEGSLFPDSTSRRPRKSSPNTSVDSPSDRPDQNEAGFESDDEGDSSWTGRESDEDDEEFIIDLDGFEDLDPFTTRRNCLGESETCQQGGDRVGHGAVDMGQAERAIEAYLNAASSGREGFSTGSADKSHKGHKPEEILSRARADLHRRIEHQRHSVNTARESI
ncbi:hypothetical protein IE53DRAFT_383408 [Violaceomyces palustris]|uniref:Uncharacterized protein n=1 Tax=Violaceomyces palustris TaxID=1673888 RepID=A0ACD0P7H2_9BASI|nr:hypothetical protein IE53DRAFT_383408 [Violaceomyces palustris]